MEDYIEIGAVPAEEQCQQAGTPHYDPLKARAECRQFIVAIRREIGPEPHGAELRIRSNSHDFGTYYEVACYYDTTFPEAVDYALRCESESPVNWNASDRRHLREIGVIYNDK